MKMLEEKKRSDVRLTIGGETRAVQKSEHAG